MVHPPQGLRKQDPSRAQRAKARTAGRDTARKRDGNQGGEAAAPTSRQGTLEIGEHQSHIQVQNPAHSHTERTGTQGRQADPAGW